MPPRKPFYTLRPGRIPYRAGLDLQEKLLQPPGPEADLLILLEHDPVITMGRNGSPGHLLSAPEILEKEGIALCSAARGGDITYHAPGQLIGYPIFNLKTRDRDLHHFIRNIEQVLIESLHPFQIEAQCVPGRTGIWSGSRKLASIGLGVRRWWSWHGFALNIDLDLAGFRHIIPCGLEGVEMTSLAQLLPQPPTQQTMENAIIDAFASIFHLRYEGDYAQAFQP